MNEVTLTSVADNAFEVSMTPIIVNPIGSKMKDRVSSVLATASASTSLALINVRGTIGKLARENAAGQGVVGVIQQASNSNYRPMAEWLAIMIGGSVIVRNRAEYEFLPTILDMRIMDAESKGTAAGLKAADKLRAIRNDLVEMQAQAESIFQAKKAAREQAKRDASALANEAGITDVQAN